MKVSVVISLCDNRLEMLKRSLDTWRRQTFPKSDFELVMVDDANRLDIYELCNQYAKNTELQFQYIRIDNSKCIKPVKTFIPVLSNNVGFRFSKGKVVVVTGPETLQSPKNIEISYSLNYRKECAYGLVYRSSKSFTDYISKNWNKDHLFDNLLKIPGATADCRTRLPHPPAYWYYMAVAKKYVEKIGGVDEEFAAGFCAEDDDFANRMKMAGAMPVFEHKIVGIHQDHSVEDSINKAHSIRNTPEGMRMRQKNIALMKKNLHSGKMVANTDHRWGDESVVILHDKF